jgi:SAM-dependent methyltransferase
MKKEEIRRVVREGYARVAKGNESCCGPKAPCWDRGDLSKKISKAIGYTEEDLKSVPEGANLGLGCGNPVALASLRDGETVLDLGSGPGFDCFLAANRVGKDGRVIGVDMTPEMLEQARDNARSNGYENVEFRLGEIENLPVADDHVDVVISNCVINLSPDKPRVFGEAFRVLKPGGRLMVSDLILLKELPDSIRNSVSAYVGCLSGAMFRDAYLDAIREAGFRDVEIADETAFPIDLMANDPTAQVVMEDLEITEEIVAQIAHSVASIKVSAVKPG